MTRVSPPRIGNGRSVGDRIATEWHHEGRCCEPDVDFDWFYHPEGERGTDRERRDRKAKEICVQCPVMLMCRDAARSRREQYGLWGGETEFERARYLANPNRVYV